MRALFRLIALPSLALGLNAQAQVVQAPQIWLPPDQGNAPVVLDSVAIEVRMHGFLARTRIELVFDNPNPRILEGEFVFPLGQGQTVTGYALEVDGALREGVVVPKETARVAFEETTRVRIDPGLAELTRGNVFRTRLYPIPARGKKRIALEFEQVMDDAGSHWRYLMPLHFREPVRHFSVQAEAPLDAPAPELGLDSPDAALQFTAAASVWRAQLARENITPQRELAFRVPKKPSDVSLMEAPDRLEPAERALLALVDTGRPADPPAPVKPSRIALFFDASGSAAERDLAREREALADWFKTLGTVQVDLVALRDVAEAPRRFTLKNGDAKALIAALESLPLDGASNYGAIDFGAVRKADLALVMGDGLDTFGSGVTDYTNAPARVFVLHAAQRADHARLAQLARHGGQVLDLTRIDASQVVSGLNAASWQLLAIEADHACTDAGPSAPSSVGDVLVFTARCRGQGTVTLRFGSSDGRHVLERKLAVGQSEPVTAELAGTVWRAVAQARIAQLQAEPAPDIEAITRLAVRRGVVTAHTSLLVLDRIEDYVRYGVEPPEPELRAHYQRLLAAAPKTGGEADRDTRLRELAQRWQAFRDWHGQRHPWLETLLEPTARNEWDVWQGIPSSDTLPQKQLDATRKELDRILTQTTALVERWRHDGAEAGSRARWEREATALMLRLDDVREARRTLAPDSLNNPSAAPQPALPMSIPAPPPPSPAPEPAPEAQELVAPAPMADAARASARMAREAAQTLDSTSVPGDPSPAPKAAPPALSARIQLSGWDPDTPYLKSLREAAEPYAAYLELRKVHARTPTFFLDAADFFRTEARQPGLALRVLSNLAEIGDENTALVRILGYRLVQWDRPELAIRPFEDAIAQRPEEPQSHRDLALALSRLEQPDAGRAAGLLWQVVEGNWSARFPDIDLIALHELTALLASHPGTDISGLRIPADLLAPIEVGLRVVLTWDADNTDIDLHVIDPVGEEIFYGHRRSVSGGDLSKDFTQGYGPEVFTIARPLPGTYRVETKYYGDRRQSITGPVSVQVEFQTGFGSREPAREATTRRLEASKERIEIGVFRIQPGD